MKHLSDKRRPKCGDDIASKVAPMTLKVVAELDEQDRLIRAKSRVKGLTYVASSKQALREDGKLTGCCRV